MSSSKLLSVAVVLTAFTTFVVWPTPIAEAIGGDRIQLGGRPFVRVEARANAFTPSEQAAGALALVPNGELVVAFSSRRQQAGRSGVYARRFDACGARVGDEMPLAVASGYHDTAPALAVSGEAVWAGFESFDRDGDLAGCFVRRIDAGANLPERGASVHVRGAQRSLTLAPAADRGAVAVWSGPRPQDLVPAVWWRRFAADGTPCADDQEVAVQAGLRQGPASVAAWRDGGFVVAWAVQRAGGEPAGICARVFDRAGTPAAAVVEVEALDRALEPCVATWDGGFAVAWAQQSAGGFDVVAQRFDQAGRRHGERILASIGAEQHQSGISLAIAADGELALAWNRHDVYGEADVLVRLFAADGTPRGEAVVVTADRAGHQALPIATGKSAIAFGSDGQLALAWSGQGRFGDQNGAHVTWLLPLPDAAAAARALREGIARAEQINIAPAVPALAPLVAAPHDPPVKGERPAVADLPFGGDSNPQPLADFGFVGIVNTGWTPPDPHLAVGPAHVVAMTNGAIAFFTKAGGKTFQQQIEAGAGFWGALGAGGLVFDPEVIFDPHSNRFIAMAAEQGARSLFWLAVSDDADPNGTWFKYRLDVTTLGGGADIDSPNLAVDANTVYLSADFFNTGDKYLVYMLDKAPLLAGQPVGTTKSLVVNGSQSYGLPVTYGSAPAQYMLQHFEAASSSVLRLHAITNALTTPQRTTFDLTVPLYRRPAAIPQRGTTGTTIAFEARFWSCVWRDGSLWATHHQGSPTTLARWYEIRTNGWPASGSVPTLAQSGDLDLGPGIYTSFTSIAVDAGGNALLSCARSSRDEWFSVVRAYRLATDPPGTMPSVEIVKTSNGGSSSNRWGDYSQVAADPVDACTLWYTDEYAASQGSWNTWIGKRQVCSLAASPRALVASQGGAIGFRLANAGKAGAPYLLLGTLSGTQPGFVLPSATGGLVVPINLDPFTQLGIASANAPAFVNFLGMLDAAGTATATFNLPAVSLVSGATAHFAYVQDGTVWDFASNPVAVQIVP